MFIHSMLVKWMNQSKEIHLYHTKNTFNYTKYSELSRNQLKVDMFKELIYHFLHKFEAQ